MPENKDKAANDPVYQTYIGCKIIKARRMIQKGQQGYEVLYPDGYVSWSPVDVFEEAYRLINHLECEMIR